MIHIRPRGAAMIDWDDAFDNSGYVPDADKIAEGWVASAAAFRATFSNAELDMPYGGHARETLDLFMPSVKPIGTVVFVHGGYWHMRAKSDWSHFAKGFLSLGWAVAIVGYPLAPDVRISRITASIAVAISVIAKKVAGPLSLVGHSAGGHLVSRMVCTGVLPEAILDRLARCVSVSGVHDLRQLMGTKMNETLQLTEAEAQTESPVLLGPETDVPVTFWVGAEERPEFLRQTRLIAETWALKGVDVASVYEAGQNHFTVIDALSNPDSRLVAEVLR